jgi:hypothetical protein
MISSTTPLFFWIPENPSLITELISIIKNHPGDIKVVIGTKEVSLSQQGIDDIVILLG